MSTEQNVTLTKSELWSFIAKAKSITVARIRQIKKDGDAQMEYERLRHMYFNLVFAVEGFCPYAAGKNLNVSEMNELTEFPSLESIGD